MNRVVMQVMTEAWVGESMFCPNCGQVDLEKYGNNRPVVDFYCANCHEELKSKVDSMGVKIVDGAYGKMIERLTGSNNPNFFELQLGEF